MLQLAHCNLEGTGVRVNPDNYYSWTSQAFFQMMVLLTDGFSNTDIVDDFTFARVVTCLGDCFMDGIGVTKNLLMAAQFYEMGAKLCFRRAQLHLGDCYEFGYGVESDIEMAVYWYQQASCHNSDGADDEPWPRALRVLARCYRDGTGVEKDLEEAERIEEVFEKVLIRKPWSCCVRHYDRFGLRQINTKQVESHWKI